MDGTRSSFIGGFSSTSQSPLIVACDTGNMTKRATTCESIRFHALGTDVLVCAPPGANLACDLRDIVEAHEERFSRFRPSSELERLNAQAGREVSVSLELVEVLSLAASFWRETHGVFEPLVRRHLEAAGYDRSFERVPASSTTRSATPGSLQVSFDAVAVHPDTRTVHLPQGCTLDLGGIAKGWIVDRIGALLEPYGPHLVDIGGDIVCRGRGPDGDPGWLISVTDPYRADQDLCWLRLDGWAVATSTTMRRRWRRAGRWQHHLIDPRTGRPAETNLNQVTVVAATAVQADVYAKTALILGRQKGSAWLAERDAPALLAGPGGVTTTQGWQRFALPAQEASQGA